MLTWANGNATSILSKKLDITFGILKIWNNNYLDCVIKTLRKYKKNSPY